MIKPSPRPIKVAAIPQITQLRPAGREDLFGVTGSILSQFPPLGSLQMDEANKASQAECDTPGHDDCGGPLTWHAGGDGCGPLE